MKVLEMFKTKMGIAEKFEIDRYLCIIQKKIDPICTRTIICSLIKFEYRQQVLHNAKF